MTHLDGLDNCPLHRDTPFGIRGVSQSQFSIARHYGGIKFRGQSYTYCPDTDELIRDDVLRWKHQQERAEKVSKVESLPGQQELKEENPHA